MSGFIFAVGFLLVASSALADGKRAPPISACPDGYTLLERATREVRGSYVPFAALKRELPWMPDPEQLKAGLPACAKAWAKDHPRNPDNFPFPENRTGVEWAKKVLRDLDTDPYHRYPDLTTRLLTQADREATVAQLKRELAEIETRNYPMKDTVITVTRVLSLLEKIDGSAPIPSEIIKVIEKKLGASLGISEQTKGDLQKLHSAAYDALGIARRETIAQYEKVLLATIQEAAQARELKVDALRELRREQFKFPIRLDEKDGRDLQGYQVDPDPNQIRPLMLLPGEVSDRALAEMTIFEVDGGSLMKYFELADTEALNSHRFLAHDTNHTRITRQFDVARQLIAKTPSQKHELLARIDAIERPRQKQLAEAMLLIALREPVDSWLAPGEDLVFELQYVFKKTTGEIISDAEARDMAVWWRENIPAPKGYKRN